jgi:hypothetical protein
MIVMRALECRFLITNRVPGTDDAEHHRDLNTRGWWSLRLFLAAARQSGDRCTKAHLSLG